MQIFLVGGAVRDELLGLPIKEKDWVVVGATPETMLAQGFKQVGKDFPVFLHPTTHEEYALARLERKVSKGYTGFTFDTAPTVTLTEDLLRRDLTINAIAQNKEGELFDPFHGQEDLKRRLLRHVSPAFVEDPVRILRLGRFLARFADLGFQVAPETKILMQQMVLNGEIDALVAERVWKEWERALGEKSPQAFFEVLKNCGALKKLFPYFSDANMLALSQACSISKDLEVRFAALMYNVSCDQVAETCDRFKVPSTYKNLAILLSRYFSVLQNLNWQDEKQIINLLQHLDAFRRPERLKQFLLSAEALGLKPTASLRLAQLFSALEQMDNKKIISLNSGKDIAAAIYAARLKKIQDELLK